MFGLSIRPLQFQCDVLYPLNLGVRVSFGEHFFGMKKMDINFMAILKNVTMVTLGWLRCKK